MYLCVHILYGSRHGAVSLVSRISEKLATFPANIAMQRLCDGVRKVDRRNVRNCHTPLLVLPEVFLVKGDGRLEASCLSCNVCERCHDDTFFGDSDVFEDGVFLRPLICDCPSMQCEICKKTIMKRGFSDSRWHNRHAQKMICLLCEEAGKLHPCRSCGVLQPAPQYTDSMWHNRKQQPAVCKACQTLNIPEVHECTVCETLQPAPQYTDSMWHHRKQQPAVCKACETLKIPEVHECTVCETLQPARQYTDSMWHHRKERAAQCKQCQAKNACRSTSKFPVCSACNKAMPKGSRDRFNKSGSTTWTCGECIRSITKRK